MDNLRAARHVRSAIIGVVAALTMGCGAGGPASGAATQVVAKVNGRELTVSQLNYELVEMNAADSGEASTQRAIKRLIDKELLVQAATKAKLDRDPAVKLRIDAVEREILARAYAEGHVYPRGLIEESDLKKFYDDNPALFSARRVYHAVAFSTDQRQLPDTLLADLSHVHSVDGLRAILNQYQVNFQVEEMTRGAEAMPLDSLARIAAADVGDVVASAGDDGQAQLLLLRSIDSRPVSFENAKNSIAHFVRGKRDQAALQAHLQELQAGANIEYASANSPLTVSQ
jgi:peptidyl-prolyl cis-trans isomerase C